jgi:glycerophosphoryl diester phosphodiesterase
LRNIKLAASQPSGIATKHDPDRGITAAGAAMTGKRPRRRIGRKIVWLLAALCAVGIYLFGYEPQYAGPINCKTTPLVIAHRGFGDQGVDNGISAVKLAIAHGMDGVDLDAQLTADHELVIFHDPNVDRLTDGHGFIKDMSLAELRELDMGAKFGTEYAGEKIQTFGEMLDEVNGKLLLIVEIKAGGMADEGSERIAVNAIRQRKAYDHVVLSSFNPFALYRIKRLDPHVVTMFIFRDIEPDDPTQYRKIPWFLKSEICRRAIRKIIRPDMLSMETTVDSGTYRTLRSRGYPILLWSPNDPTAIKAATDRQPYGIITDKPQLAADIIPGHNE